MSLLIFEKGLDTADKIQLVLSYILQLAIIGQLIFALYNHGWLTAFASAGILLLTFLPSLFRRNWKVYLPIELEVLVVLFIFASLYLGEIHAYYTWFWWWDIVLHTSSGVLLGFAAFILVYVLNEEPRIHLSMKPGFVALFSFTFAVTIGVIWEVFEFIMDQLFSTLMQHNSVVDTMWDLVVDSGGALVVSVLGYFYVKNKERAFIFDRIIRRFVERNPRLFRKRHIFKKLKRKIILKRSMLKGKVTK